MGSKVIGRGIKVIRWYAGRAKAKVANSPKDNISSEILKDKTESFGL